LSELEAMAECIPVAQHRLNDYGVAPGPDLHAHDFAERQLNRK
jgi:hypothetical protein